MKNLRQAVRRMARQIVAGTSPRMALRLTGCCLVEGSPSARSRVVFPAESGINPPPLHIGGHPATDPPETYQVPAARLHEIEGAWLSHLSGVHARDGRMVPDLGGLTPHNRSELEAGRHPLRWHAAPVFSGTTLTLATSQQWNYFHWLFEVLGRLAIARQAGVRWDRLYVENSRRFQMESLAALGVADGVVVDSASHPLVRCGRLAAPDCPDAFTHQAGWMVDFLRKEIRVEPGDSPRIFIARRTGFRRLTNIDEVASFLRERGFREVIPEEMGFTEQAALFAGARVVVGTHGAALANLAFCRPGAHVIEILPPRYCHWVYYSLACRAGLAYACVVGEGEPDPAPWTFQKEDVNVSINNLVRALEAAA